MSLVLIALCGFLVGLVVGFVLAVVTLSMLSGAASRLAIDGHGSATGPHSRIATPERIVAVLRPESGPSRRID